MAARIHVVGAGPSGSIAAISAIRNGADVVISEEHGRSGIPENCSGLFSIDGLRSLSQFLRHDDLVINRIRGADIHFAGEKISIRRKSPVAYVCDRSRIDRALIEKASDEGAQVRYNERISGRFHSDNIIGADGPLSSVARHFSFPRIPCYAATLQARIPYRSQENDIVELFFSNHDFPGFFAWVIPHDERTAEFGVGVEVPNRALDAWQRLLNRKGVESQVTPKGAAIPLNVRSQTAKQVGKQSVLLVGDAAGQVKSTTGGGVIFGGNCAAIAGRHFDDPLRYELAWRFRYGPDLAMHKWLHDHLASLSDRDMAALGRRLKRMDMEGYLSSQGHMDKPSRMLKPDLLAHMLKNIAGIV